MVEIQRVTQCPADRLQQLKIYLDERRDRIHPYQTLEFSHVIDKTFGYDNYSLVAWTPDSGICGYLPQWNRQRVLESVPWRDRGGPVYEEDGVLEKFIETSKAIVDKEKLKGFLWKDFKTDRLDFYEYFVSVQLDLTGYNESGYWEALSSKERNKLRLAEKNGLTFREDTDAGVDRFYELFFSNRKRLGVPVFQKSLFEHYRNEMPGDRLQIFSVYQGESCLSSMILIRNNVLAIDAYSASDHAGLKLKANDFLKWNVIRYCMQQGIRTLDFGADSPLQTSLIQFKTKWLGQQRTIATSRYGDVREGDHNEARYNTVKSVIRKLPDSLYRMFSKFIVQ